MPDTSETLEVMLRRQRVLADFGDFALQSENLDEVLNEACRLVAEAMGTQRAKVLEIEEGSESLLVRAGVGWKPDIVGRVRIPMNERSSESFAIAEGKPVLMQDVAHEERFDVPTFIKAEGVRSLVNVPVVLPGLKANGLLQIAHTEPRDFDPERHRVPSHLRGHSRSGPRPALQVRGAVVGRGALLRDRGGRDRLRHPHDRRPGPNRRLVARGGGSVRLEREGGGWAARGCVFTREDMDEGVPGQAIETARREGHAPSVRWYQGKDGSRVFIDGMLRALHDEQGRPEGFIKVSQDVIEPCANRERLRTLREGIPQLVWRSGNGGRWTWASRQ